MRVSWITGNTVDKNNMFFTSLVQNGDISLFRNENIIQIINYFWKITRPFFVREIFIPFILLNFLPVLLVPLTYETILET